MPATRRRDRDPDLGYLQIRQMPAELADHVFVNQHPGRVPIAHVDDSHRPAAASRRIPSAA